MSILLIQLKKISTFIYILLFLLLFNVLFNLYSHWYGISLIVRIYIFVFSFYLIFNYSQISVDRLLDKYRKRFGSRGEPFLFFETRIVPFMVIYLITVIFTFIDYLIQPHWPWNALMNILNGRYSNIIIYSLFLLLVLKWRKKPSVTIPVFVALCVSYFFLDKLLYAGSPGGAGVLAIQLAKIVIILFLLFYEFFGKGKKILSSLVHSLILGAFFMSARIGLFYGTFAHSVPASYQKKEAGLLLMRMGFTFPLSELKETVIKTSDYELFASLLRLARHYQLRIDYTDAEWRGLLFSGTVQMADFIAEYVGDKQLELPWEVIVGFAERKSATPGEQIENAAGFIRLSARYVAGREYSLIEKAGHSGRTFKLWAFAVLGEQKNPASIPPLLDYLTDMDANLAEGAYTALKKITDLDPKEKLGARVNDPEVLIMFKDYYLRNRKGS